MDVHLEYVRPHEGWLNYDTAHLYEIVNSDSQLKEARNRAWTEFKSPEDVLDFYLVKVRGKYIVPDESVWNDAEIRVDWTTILREWTAQFEGLSPPVKNRTMSGAPTRRRYLERNLLGFQNSQGDEVSTTIEDPCADPSKAYVAFRVNHARAVMYSRSLRMAYIQMQTPYFRIARDVCNTLLDLFSLSSFVRVDAVSGYVSGEDRLILRTLDAGRGVWRSPVLASNLGILADQDSLKYHVYLEGASHAMARAFSQDPSAVARKVRA